MPVRRMGNIIHNKKYTYIKFFNFIKKLKYNIFCINYIEKKNHE